eukprot:gnl/TRDRNA2_/TRDRNA2_133112_c0_seq1.p1 gnl/TRDRNA2_/TRDRNA2_133112_c0~~gnl/TRDRNA2_/TRDRNA2_133112_c0_seq1.p1  ORF type:complete len:129 (+),score=24.93 gnl/TRDRNA2_/TRDRNA2_133112_c0_seq1:279-665(+)
MLTCRRFLPEWWVAQEFLLASSSVGVFRYGVVLQGRALSFEIEDVIFQDYAVYCTVYSRGSMPTVASLELSTATETLEVAQEDGFWLMRIVRKDGAPATKEVGDKVNAWLVRSTSTAVAAAATGKREL